MQSCRAGVSLVVLLSGLGLGACSAPSVMLTPRFTQVGLDGDFAADDGLGALVATDTDELGLDDKELSFSPRADADFGITHITVDRFDGSFSGSGTATGEIVIDGTTIGAGETVDSDLDLSTTSGVITWDLIPGELVELGLGLGVSVANIDARVVQTSGLGIGNTVQTEETAPIPVLAVRFGLDFDRVGFELLGRGLSVDVRDVNVTYYDLDAMARLRLFTAGPVAGHLAVGYRLVHLDADFDDGDSQVQADFDFGGPWVGLSFGF